ncbi:TROVE domain RNA-binding protein [Oleiphilus messinensis]|uniref:TROVE domain RNA-binding protein n=1 Tax=Oleiphilus messinensis TaxID=141451 RepID=A0A1Y0I7F1_9GAMM|nr:TROVE domain-containing protein [Oleiphilus messinensis]ARU55364.1 TROVE domain RNA-binding protein [Oleiphilus messinensis]
MANTTIFHTRRGRAIPAADAVNQAGGRAYQHTAEQALAQYAMTGCFNQTFYAGAVDQIATVMSYADQVSPEYLAKLAVFARERGYMKDMPAFLTALLTVKGPEWVPVIFPRVIDNGRMVRNFVQILRSGVIGRRSLGTMPKRLVKEWISRRGEASLFMDSVGNAPSLQDVIKMVRPKPENAMREAFYGYLIGKNHNASDLPKVVQEYERFKQNQAMPLPDVDFRLLTALNLSTDHWVGIARNANWQMTRMNLNTFARHGVFRVNGMDQVIARRLRDEKAIRRAKVFPYQLMAAYFMADETVPDSVIDALQDAMEIALQNVPAISGNVVVLPDTSYSMTQPVTGYRKGASSKVRCVDVAALVSAAIVARNPKAQVLPFDTKVHWVRLNARDSIMSNAARLAGLGGGGTNCAAPLIELNRQKAKVDTVIYVSDNESWVDAQRFGYGYASRSGAGTGVMAQWSILKQRNPDAKLVCIDVVPNRTTQAIEREDILNIGGFSDQVFSVIDDFIRNEPQRWVQAINRLSLS